MNLSVCHRLKVKPLTGLWYRAIGQKYAATPLQTFHTRGVPSRFNGGSKIARQHEALYLCESSYVAQLEMKALFDTHPDPGGPITNPNRPPLPLQCSVVLHRTIDLTDTVVQGILQTNAQELTGDWEGYDNRSPSTSVKAPAGLAPTQALAEALFTVPELEGFVSLSAKDAIRKVLVVFPEKLSRSSTSYVEYTDPSTGLRHALP